MRISTSIIVWASCFTISSAVLDNLPNFNGGTVPWIDKLKDTTPPAHFIRKRATGTAPQHCIDTANTNQFCNPYNIEVFDIYYADVSTTL